MANLHITKNISALLLCSLLLTACDKFLDITPKGFTLLTTVNDYNQWLNDPSLCISTANERLNNFSDLIDVPDIAVPQRFPGELSYVWAPQYPLDADLWGLHYDKINKYNSVINGVDKATGGTAQQKESLKAEALLGRAFEYFYLVNEYGQPYDPATASKNPGVQLITSDDVAQEVPPRSTLQQSYEFIIADLNASIENLPDNNTKNRYRGSKAAAYSLLARVYFFERDYDKAAENAMLALSTGPDAVMVDYNTISTTSPFAGLAIRPDAIYARLGAIIFYPTVDFLQSYDVKDIRVKLCYSPGTISAQRGVVSYYLFNGAFSNTGTTVQEMKLIIAEAAARRNDLTEALKQLDEVRKKRIQTAFYQSYQSNDPEAVLTKILDERRFEFPFVSLRWFDMRRLDAEGRMPAVKRYDAKGNVIATLAPHSPRYTLQIPDAVIRFNPGMTQNP